MSYAIIRNAKYKSENLKGIYRHNERRNTNYSNKNIDRDKSYLNYSLKSPQFTYEKEFQRIRKDYNLKGQIKTVSNIVCEYIITSDKAFFETIGEDETKRYFETAYKFVCQYKNLGEQYILSAKVHMDEETPHMHLIFIPVVHTTDKKGNNIDKIACSEFWKAKDSYRQLQDAFYNYMVANNFELELGNPSEKVHLSVEDYKNITNFEESKTLLQDIKIELPEVPDISNFRWTIKNRDERIQEQIIKPKDKTIQKLHEQNALLTLALNRQIKTVDKAIKYEKDIKPILDENAELKEKYETMENDYNIRLQKETEKIENKYEEQLSYLENENNFLKKVINTLQKTVHKFIEWICIKFSITNEDSFIRKFECENDISFDPEKQIEPEEELEYEEMEW
ncbi:MAG: plasmid recombination protein [Clostridia bacterium]|nr:plasmid recombination protein [Clostridia bacterium]